MARQKKEIHKVEMTDGKRAIIQQLFREYNIESATDIQDALKDLLSGTIKQMMETEMDKHLGYSKSERSDSENARNGYKSKRVNSSYSSFQIDVPQERQSSSQPQVVKKRPKDISAIDEKIISMYAKGMTTRQISETLEDITASRLQRVSYPMLPIKFCLRLRNGRAGRFPVSTPLFLLCHPLFRKA